MITFADNVNRLRTGKQFFDHSKTEGHMKTLMDVKKRIDSFPRPAGYNPYAWNVAKKVALEAWECYLFDKPFRRSVRGYCDEFYEMLRKGTGEMIFPVK